MVLSDAGQADLVAMLGAPTMLLVLAAALIVEVALLGRSITEAEREWWSRFGALVLISALLWVLAFATILYVPALFLGIGLPVRLLIASGWLGTIVAGVVAGRNVRPAKTGGSGVLGVIAAVAPPIFMVGILGALALLGAFLVNDPQVVFPAAGSEDVGVANYLRGVRNASFPRILAWLALFGVLAWMGSTLIDVNLFSLNAMYANRLIRCYLGAARRKARWADRWGGLHDCTVLSGAPTEITNRARDPNPVTGFDPEDDLDLLDLRIGSNAPQKEDHRTYWGPQVLINTSLNLVGGDELAWRDRKGESFTLSPLYCGSKGTGYALVGEGTRKQLTLGRAMSISGAAVDPNMRFYQSASLTAFLTLLNARLGYWIQNPSRCKTGPQEADLDRREPEAGQPALYRAARPDGGQGGVHPPLRRRPFREHGRVRADPKTVPLHRGLRRGGGHRALRREPRHPDAARPDRLRRSHQDRHRAIPRPGARRPHPGPRRRRPGPLRGRG